VGAPALDALARQWRVAAFGFTAAVGVLLLWSGAGDGIDQALRNGRADLRQHSASGEVHIVEIDDRSIEAFEQWPWPRHIHAAAIDRLRRSGAALIAFDVDFSSPSQPKEDEALAAALGRAGGSVILPTFRRSGIADAAPIPSFADQSFLATANVFTETGGELRNMPYGDSVGGVPRPSLASLVAEHPGGAGELFPIDRSIDPASIPRHSMVDIVAGRVPASELAGKRILIGATAVEVGDRYTVARHGPLPGVVVQALAAETLLQGTPPTLGGAGWALGLALLMAAAGLRMRRGWTFGLAFASAPAAILLLFLAAERFLVKTGSSTRRPASPTSRRWSRNFERPRPSPYPSPESTISPACSRPSAPTVRPSSSAGSPSAWLSAPRPAESTGSTRPDSPGSSPVRRLWPAASTASTP
jgi:CHASE2 domain-containing sensor protein